MKWSTAFVTLTLLLALVAQSPAVQAATVPRKLISFGDIVNTVGDGISNAANTVKDGVVGAANTVGTAVTGAYDTVSTGAVGAAQTVANFTVNVAGDVKDGVVSAYNKAANFTEGAAQTVAGVAVAGYTKTRDGAEQIFGVVKNGTVNAANKTADFGRNAGDRIASTWDVITGDVRTALVPGIRQVNTTNSTAVPLAPINATDANALLVALSQGQSGAVYAAQGIVAAVRLGNGTAVSNAIGMLLNPTASPKPTAVLSANFSSNFGEAATFALEQASAAGLNTTDVAMYVTRGFIAALQPCAAAVPNKAGETADQHERAVAQQCCYIVDQAVVATAVYTEADGSGNDFFYAVEMSVAAQDNVNLEYCLEKVSVS